MIDKLLYTSMFLLGTCLLVFFYYSYARREKLEISEYWKMFWEAILRISLLGILVISIIKIWI